MRSPHTERFWRWCQREEANIGMRSSDRPQQIGLRACVEADGSPEQLLTFPGMMSVYIHIIMSRKFHP